MANRLPARQIVPAAGPLPTSRKPPLNAYDVLIIGSGLAGLSAALRLAPHRKVALVTKHELLDGASAWAQGGIAAVLDSTDSLENHVRDTHVAGAGLCHDDAVRFVVERGRPRRSSGSSTRGCRSRGKTGGAEELHLHREGGHSHRRIVHAADATGNAVQRTLVERVRATPTSRSSSGTSPSTSSPAASSGLGDNRCLGRLRPRPEGRQGADPRARARRSSPRAARARSTSTRRTPTRRRATASPWAGAPAARWPTWSSSSSTPPASTTRTRRASSSPRRCAARAGS